MENPAKLCRYIPHKSALTKYEEAVEISDYRSEGENCKKAARSNLNEQKLTRLNRTVRNTPFPFCVDCKPPNKHADDLQLKTPLFSSASLFGLIITMELNEKSKSVLVSIKLLHWPAFLEHK